MIIFKTAPDFHFDHIKLLSCTLLWFTNDSVGIRLEISFFFFIMLVLIALEIMKSG